MADTSDDPAAAAKAAAGALYREKKYAEAIESYAAAIALKPDDHTLFSNRCACRQELMKGTWGEEKEAHLAAGLEDARQCCALSPTFLRGAIRLATISRELGRDAARKAELSVEGTKGRVIGAKKGDEDSSAGDMADQLGRFGTDADNAAASPDAAKLHAECEAACRAGLAVDGTNEPLRKLLQECRDAGFNASPEADEALRDAASAAPHKADGNGHFGSKDYSRAEESFSAAMAWDPCDHVFYSNRSACRAALDKFKEALADADNCVRLKPAWAKGYNRRAVALFHLGRYADSEAACEAGLEIDASSAALAESLAAAKVETSEPLAVQQHMHKLREEGRNNAKLENLMKSLNMGGPGGPQVMNFGANGSMNNAGMGGFANLFGGGGGGGGGLGKPKMSESQMRQMARAMATAPPAPPAGDGGGGEPDSEWTQGEAPAVPPVVETDPFASPSGADAAEAVGSDPFA